MKVSPLLASLFLLAACPGDDDTVSFDAAPVDGAVPDARPDAAPDFDAPPADASVDAGPPGTVACPQPDPGRFMVCGVVFDLADGSPVAGAKVTFYDALEFATSPRAVPFFAVTSDAHGHYASATALDNGVFAPAFLLVHVDDVDQPDVWIPTGVAVPAAANTRAFVDAFVARRDGAFGPYAAEGAVVGIYSAAPIDAAYTPELDLQPVAGIQLTADGDVDAEALYFGDSQPDSRTTIDPSSTTTGANGTAISQHDAIVPFGGSGPRGCTVTSRLAGKVAGALLVSIMHAEGCTP